ncbi:NTPase [Nodosilinea sp. LEGE 07298]|uniref:P-loop NTPase fold protein n=1 Tax=Nodosilinea sp. LEGE 07298 TaxID=2777970 RepID=UPI00187EE416|nr:P-loop NTPase fold protein [Nodosilinea sp. LEGE 07298]MBE9113859.1 NTPase [Nodosilinea sp. LEGE 07298]
MSLLIFDDLERCKIDLSSLLGYINFFVEHNGMKVILIADEEKLLKDEDYSSIYSSIKEKLIGKTLSISPSFDDVLTSSIGKIEVEKAKDFLANNFDAIKDLYQKSDCKNLRSLNHIVLEFARIFQALPERVQNHSEALTDLLRALTAFLIEIRQGKISPKDIEKLTTEYANFLSKKLFSPSDRNDRRKNENENEEDHLLEFIDTYPFLDMYSVFPSLTWWKRFFDQGAIDLEELELSISSSKYFQDESTPNWMKLWHFSELSDEDFEELITKIEQDYRDRIFSDIGEITHIVGLFLRFSKAGIYKRSKKDILDDSISYVDDLKRSSRLEPLPQHVPFYESIGSTSGYYRNLAFQERETEEFNEFRSYLESARREVYSEGIPQKAQELLEFMCNDIPKFHRMICYDSPLGQDDGPGYHEEPVLNYIEPSLFVEKVLAMKNEDARQLLWMLSERYKHGGINEKLIQELEWLKSIQRLVLEEVSRREGKLSGYILSLSSQEYIHKAIERLSSKKEDFQE